MLTDSPWAQTQVFSDTSSMTFSPTQVNRSHEVENMNYYIRFLSAKPIRQALYRNMELSGKMSPAQLDEARKFVDRDFGDSIVVTVLFTSGDPQLNAAAFANFTKVITSTLKNSTYLEVKTGTRQFLQEYVPPGSDGLGAKFIFSRTYNGEPLISPSDKNLRFVVRYSFTATSGTSSGSSASSVQNMNLNMQFKIADMMFNGVLEY
jgi:hypothetical protein